MSLYREYHVSNPREIQNKITEAVAFSDTWSIEFGPYYESDGDAVVLVLKQSDGIFWGLIANTTSNANTISETILLILVPFDSYSSATKWFNQTGIHRVTIYDPEIPGNKTWSPEVVLPAEPGGTFKLHVWLTDDICHMITERVSGEWSGFCFGKMTALGDGNPKRFCVGTNETDPEISIGDSTYYAHKSYQTGLNDWSNYSDSYNESFGMAENENGTWYPIGIKANTLNVYNIGQFSHSLQPDNIFDGKYRVRVAPYHTAGLSALADLCPAEIYAPTDADSTVSAPVGKIPYLYYMPSGDYYTGQIIKFTNEHVYKLFLVGVSSEASNSETSGAYLAVKMPKGIV